MIPIYNNMTNRNSNHSYLYHSIIHPQIIDLLRKG